MIIGVVLIIVSVGAVLFYGASHSGGGQVLGGVDVLVASHDINVRDPLTSADVKVAKFSSSDKPPSALASVSEVKGKVAGTTILKGQPLLGNQLATQQDQITGSQVHFLPIPKGYVAFSIPTSESIGVANFIQPGDYITIQATVPSGRTSAIRTIYTNLHIVKVTANQGELAPDAKPTTDAGKIPSGLLTVVVTQCQSEYLNWFLSNATLKYTLESPQDYASPPTKPDPTCANVDAATGITLTQINTKYPGLFTTTGSGVNGG